MRAVRRRKSLSGTRPWLARPPRVMNLRLSGGRSNAISNNRRRRRAWRSARPVMCVPMKGERCGNDQVHFGSEKRVSGPGCAGKRAGKQKGNGPPTATASMNHIERIITGQLGPDRVPTGESGAQTDQRGSSVLRRLPVVLMRVMYAGRDFAGIDLHHDDESVSPRGGSRARRRARRARSVRIEKWG